MELVRLEPGKEQVVFELPLEAIFGVKDPPQGGWVWDWPRRPEPPRSPIHRYRQAGFLEQARFKVTLTVAGKQFASPQVVLKIKAP